MECVPCDVTKYFYLITDIDCTHQFHQFKDIKTSLDQKITQYATFWYKILWNCGLELMFQSLFCSVDLLDLPVQIFHRMIIWKKVFPGRFFTFKRFQSNWHIFNFWNFLFQIIHIHFYNLVGYLRQFCFKTLILKYSTNE